MLLKHCLKIFNLPNVRRLRCGMCGKCNVGCGMFARIMDFDLLSAVEKLPSSKAPI